MVIKENNPVIEASCIVKGKSNGIQYIQQYSGGSRTTVWPIRVKKRMNGVYYFCPKYMGVCRYAGKIVYDFTKEAIRARHGEAWLDIHPSDVFYDQVKEVYEINAKRKLKQKQKKDELEFARCLNAVYNDFDEKTFMEILLDKFKIVIAFDAQHEIVKAYNILKNAPYKVALNLNGVPYYDRTDGKNTKTMTVWGKLGEIKLSGVYTYKTLLDVVNLRAPWNTTMEQLKEIIGVEQVKEAI